ncbi:phosphatidate cytidylyltransferase [Peptostreptococcus faecalis]|uniref:phosphatidate cytidylyltransferase n=1 Tax=Peptostreptococcus faecalis TaxID=2045015 RepID=UPI000C7D0663|nr:phosphatidate cytidylyltransferase [Peptostreptococcus faecalis]
MKQRLISALTMLPLLILVVVRGIPLYIGGAILMIIALHEFYSVFENIKRYPIKELGYIFSIIMLAGNVIGWNIQEYSFVLFFIFVISIVYVLMQKRDVLDLCITFSGILYVCFCFNFIIWTCNNISNGAIYVWLIFIISFGTDIFAYLVGIKFGKHKLIPKVSPKKTIEGSIGGILGSIAFSVIFGIIFNLNIGVTLIIAFIGSIIAQMGDLIASSVKRYAGVKDYGKLIPGHGGILDRFDSVLLVSPYVYIVLFYLVG